MNGILSIESIVMTEDKILIPNQKRRLVICGSMSAYSLMLKVQDCLRAQDIATIVPEPEDEHTSTLSQESFESFKRNVSSAYLRKIRDPDTYGILAVNPDKHDIRDYIGPNTFAEIAVAFAQSKKLFLYYGLPEVYTDELRAWKAIQLNGNIEFLVQEFLAHNRVLTAQRCIAFPDVVSQ